MTQTSPPVRIFVVAGPCATGKTTLVRNLAEILRWPVLAKDSFKELLYDQLGAGDRLWSQKLGTTSFELVWLIAEQLARANVSHIIEYPCTNPDFLNRGLKHLKQKYNVVVILVELTATAGVIVNRVGARMKVGDRHPAHHDLSILEDLKKQVQPFGHLIEAEQYKCINTDSFSSLDVDELARWAVPYKS